MSQGRIIFLDIDGVLAHFGSREQLDPSCIAALDGLIDCTGADVLLTSSWRDSVGLVETQRRLTAAGFRGRLAGAVPPKPRRSRSDEIEQFLATQKRRPRFVILDDVPVDDRLQRNLVLVDDFVGLTARDVAAAAQILTGSGGNDDRRASTSNEKPAAPRGRDRATSNRAGREQRSRPRNRRRGER